MDFYHFFLICSQMPFIFLWHTRLTIIKSLITEIELITSFYIYVLYQPLFESASSTYTNVCTDVNTFLICFLQPRFGVCL